MRRTLHVRTGRLLALLALTAAVLHPITLTTAWAQPAAAPPPPLPTAVVPAAAPARLAEQLNHAEAAYESLRHEHTTLITGIRTASRAIAAQQHTVAHDRDIAGQLAASQYEGAELRQMTTALFAVAPQTALDQANQLREETQGAQQLTHRLNRETATLRRQTTELADAQDRLRRLTTAQSAALATVRTVRQTLIDALAIPTPTTTLPLPVVAEPPTDATADPHAAAAIRFAIAQLGKPYQWGATGPDSFDCSGLTSQAWLHAGVGIPRTSEQQWSALPHVPLTQLRPGDLVVYFTQASHVALYLGNDLVVQAPHPGARVEITRAGINPVLGAVRPATAATSTQLPT